MEIIVSDFTWQEYKDQIWKMCRIALAHRAKTILTIVQTSSMTLNLNIDNDISSEANHIITIHVKIPQKIINQITETSMVPTDYFLQQNYLCEVEEAEALSHIIGKFDNFSPLSVKVQEAVLL